MIEALATPDKTIFGKKMLAKFFPMPEFVTWKVVTKAAFALPLTESELAIFKEVSGRTSAPTKRCAELIADCGRRAGKTAAASGIATHFAGFHDFRPYLRPGEKATVMAIDCDRTQAKIILDYISPLPTNSCHFAHRI